MTCSSRQQGPRDMGKCAICGEPMPEGEEMFAFHGYSGPCPAPPLPVMKAGAAALIDKAQEARASVSADLLYTSKAIALSDDEERLIRHMRIGNFLEAEKLYDRMKRERVAGDSLLARETD